MLQLSREMIFLLHRVRTMLSYAAIIVFKCYGDFGLKQNESLLLFIVTKTVLLVFDSEQVQLNNSVKILFVKFVHLHRTIMNILHTKSDIVTCLKL